ncbi:MAG: outer membrane beta-barrel protein [Brumimicrobium sp.]
MKIQVLILVFGITSISSNLLLSQKKEPLFSKFKIGVNGSLDWGYRRLNTHGNSEEEAFKEYRNEVEFGSIGYSYGVSLFYSLSQKWSLETGAILSVKGCDGLGSVNPSGNYVGNPSNENGTQSFFYYNYIDFPIKVIYKFKETKMNPFISLGGIMNYFQASEFRTVNTYPDGSITDKSNTDEGRIYNPLVVSLVLSAGVNYEVKKHITVRVEPLFRYGLMSIVKDPINENLYSVGLKVGLLFN